MGSSVARAPLPRDVWRDVAGSQSEAALAAENKQAVNERSSGWLQAPEVDVRIAGRLRRPTRLHRRRLPEKGLCRLLPSAADARSLLGVPSEATRRRIRSKRSRFEAFKPMLFYHGCFFLKGQFFPRL